MPPKYVPVTMGSPRFMTAEADGFFVTEAWFPPLEVLPPHLHERMSFAIMLEGSFEVIFAGKTCACPPSTVLTEPIGERHGNRMDRLGARVLVLQPAPERTELFRPCGKLLERIDHFRHEGIAGMAWRLTRELRSADTVSPLVIDGLGLEMFALAARLRNPSPSERRPPPWLVRARELLHSTFTEPLRISNVASAVDVHPVHLARLFRAHYQVPIGAYVRRLRLDWAARQLVTSEESICKIALQAGFADQSHFTRAFKRHTGSTPARYRRALRD
jgi:AraC family transcriptional regulator